MTDEFNSRIGPRTNTCTQTCFAKSSISLQASYTKEKVERKRVPFSVFAVSLTFPPTSLAPLLHATLRQGAGSGCLGSVMS